MSTVKHLGQQLTLNELPLCFENNSFYFPAYESLFKLY